MNVDFTYNHIDETVLNNLLLVYDFYSDGATVNGSFVNRGEPTRTQGASVIYFHSLRVNEHFGVKTVAPFDEMALLVGPFGYCTD